MLGYYVKLGLHMSARAELDSEVIPLINAALMHVWGVQQTFNAYLGKQCGLETRRTRCSSVEGPVRNDRC